MRAEIHDEKDGTFSVWFVGDKPLKPNKKFECKQDAVNEAFYHAILVRDMTTRICLCGKCSGGVKSLTNES